VHDVDIRIILLLGAAFFVFAFKRLEPEQPECTCYEFRAGHASGCPFEEWTHGKIRQGK
jgi:hypothetical protein